MNEKNDYWNLCSTIETHPNNHSIGCLTNLLNNDQVQDYREVFLRCGKYLSGINLENCFHYLLKQSKSDLIEIYLQTIDDLPEHQMIESLNISFDYLKYLLMKSFDYWSLTNAMKIYLNPSKSVDLAEELISLLMNIEQQTKNNILDWFCALIDAHFSSFVLAKWNKIDLIEKFVQNRLTTFDLLQGLNSIKKSTSTITITNQKKDTNHLYTLQRIHFK